MSSVFDIYVFVLVDVVLGGGDDGGSVCLCVCTCVCLSVYVSPLLVCSYAVCRVFFIFRCFSSICQFPNGKSEA